MLMGHTIPETANKIEKIIILDQSLVQFFVGYFVCILILSLLYDYELHAMTIYHHFYVLKINS